MLFLEQTPPRGVTYKPAESLPPDPNSLEQRLHSINSTATFIYSKLLTIKTEIERYSELPCTNNDTNNTLLQSSFILFFEKYECSLNQLFEVLESPENLPVRLSTQVRSAEIKEHIKNHIDFLEDTFKFLPTFSFVDINQRKLIKFQIEKLKESYDTIYGTKTAAINQDNIDKGGKASFYSDN